MDRAPAAGHLASAAQGPTIAEPQRPTRRQLASWIISVTRPVLPPLGFSTLCRIADLTAGVALFAMSAYAVASAAQALARGEAMPSMWPLLGLMAGLSLLKALLRYGEQLLGHFVAFKALELLRGEIFRSLIPRSPRVALTMRSGEVMATATKDVDRIEVFFAHTCTPLVSAVLVPLIAGLAVGVQANWALAAVLVLLSWLGTASAIWLGSAASLYASRAASAERARLTQHVTDSVQGMSEVLGYGRAEERVAEMAQIDRAVEQAFAPSHHWAAARRATIVLLTFGSPVLLAWMGLGSIERGQLTLPVLAAVVAAGLRLTETVRGVEELAGALNQSFASAERVWQIAHAPMDVPDGAHELTAGAAHELVWEGVSYAYPGSPAQAVDGVSLTARAGQWTCLVGASGSGKSTLASLALRFDHPQQGRVTIDGMDLHELAADSLYREVGLVTQRAHLFRASVRENLRLAAPEASDEEIREACRQVGLDADIEAMPQGYDTLIGERGQSVSGGQRQRLSLARTLLARPSLVILDEFTSHLDPELDQRVRSAVKERLAGATVVEITHRLTWSKEADYVAVLDAGRVVEQGTPAELAQKDGAWKALAARA